MTNQEKIIEVRDKTKADRAMRAKLNDPENKAKEKIIKDHEAEKNRPNLQFYFASIPEKLLRDPKIPLAAKGLYGTIHTFCYDKKYDPNTKGLSHKTLSEISGISIKTIIKLEKILEETGWIEIIHRGLNMPNKIRLLYVKKRV